MFAETSFTDGKLRASFFCSHDFDDRRNLHTIFPTLVFQLTHHYPHFWQELLPVLTMSPDIRKEFLCSQMNKPTVGPLWVIVIRILIIIDALDECYNEEPTSTLLFVLSCLVDKVPFVKFFITGRPEPQIHSGFQLELLTCYPLVPSVHSDTGRSSTCDMTLVYFSKQGLYSENKVAVTISCDILFLNVILKLALILHINHSHDGISISDTAPDKTLLGVHVMKSYNQYLPRFITSNQILAIPLYFRRLGIFSR